jgi:hypothetical protein
VLDGLESLRDRCFSNRSAMSGLEAFWENLISVSDDCAHAPGKPKRFLSPAHVQATIALAPTHWNRRPASGAKRTYAKTSTSAKCQEPSFQQTRASGQRSEVPSAKCRENDPTAEEAESYRGKSYRTTTQYCFSMSKAIRSGIMPGYVEITVR